MKDAELRVVLIALRPGVRLEEHHAPGRITIQTPEGPLTVRAAGQAVDLPAAHVLTLGRAIPHDVEAREESVLRARTRELVALLLTGLVVEAGLAPIAIFHFHRAGLES